MLTKFSAQGSADLLSGTLNRGSISALLKIKISPFLCSFTFGPLLRFSNNIPMTVNNLDRIKKAKQLFRRALINFHFLSASKSPRVTYLQIKLTGFHAEELSIFYYCTA